MNSTRTLSGALGWLLVLAIGLAAGCDRPLDLDGYEFECDQPDDCVEPYVCDQEAGVCVLEDAGNTEDATNDTSDAIEDTEPSDTGDTDDTQDVEPQDTSDSSDSSDTGDDGGECTCDDENLVCNEAEVCVECLDNSGCIDVEVCVDESCQAVPCAGGGACPDGYACSFARNQCIKASDWCRDNGDCGAAQECDETGRCVAASEPTCDSLSECGPGEFCDLGGRCVTVAGSEVCNKHEECGTFGQICSHPITSQGFCINWRCDYAGVQSSCPSETYCSRVRTSNNVQYNVCIERECDPNTTFGCRTNEHCIPTTSSDGRCQDIGPQRVGALCGSAEGDCNDGLVCIRTGAETLRTCRRYCNPWQQNTGCGSGEACAPVPNAEVAGICLRSTSVDCSDINMPLGTPCDARSVCLLGRLGRTCGSVCRVGKGDCTASDEVCNPARVPGDSGLGQCEPRCGGDDGCSDIEQCRGIRQGTISYAVCAEPCQSDADCTEPGFACKDGFCD